VCQQKDRLKWAKNKKIFEPYVQFCNAKAREPDLQLLPSGNESTINGCRWRRFNRTVARIAKTGGSMKKLIRRVALGVVIVVIVALVIVWFSLDAIVKHTIQTQATASLNVPTTLQGVALSPIGGSVSLTGLDVGSPPNYTAPNMFVMDGLKVAVSYGQLLGNPIHIQKIEIDSPQLTVEQANGKLNLQAVMDQSSSAPAGGSSSSSSSSSSSQLKFIIDELDVNTAQVSLLAGLPGVSKPVNVTVPSLTLKNIGNSGDSQNGAAIKDVIMQVCTGLASKAGQSAGLSQITDQLNQLGSQLGSSFQTQLQNGAGSLGQNLGGVLGNNSSGSGNNSGSSGLQQQLGGLLGSNKKSQ
jgi:hypothetical protein